MVYERRLDLPRVGIAALAAEAYLPFQSHAPLSLAAGSRSRLASACALNWGWVAQHGAARRRCPRSRSRRPLVSLRLLFRHRRWLVGFSVGIGGWALYVAALALAPLSLVQAVSAGGIGILAAARPARLERALARREWVAVGISLSGLVLLGASLAGGSDSGRTSATAGGSRPGSALAQLAAGPLAPLIVGGAGLGLARRVLYAAGDLATKAAVGGALARARPGGAGRARARLRLPAARLPARRRARHGGDSTLLTNALPIAAGSRCSTSACPPGRTARYASLHSSASSAARRCCRARALRNAVLDPDARLAIHTATGGKVNRHESAGHDVLAVARELQARPPLPLSPIACDDHRVLGRADDPAAGSLVVRIHGSTCAPSGRRHATYSPIGISG